MVVFFKGYKDWNHRAALRVFAIDLPPANKGFSFIFSLICVVLLFYVFKQKDSNKRRQINIGSFGSNHWLLLFYYVKQQKRNKYCAMRNHWLLLFYVVKQQNINKYWIRRIESLIYILSILFYQMKHFSRR